MAGVFPSPSSSSRPASTYARSKPARTSDRRRRRRRPKTDREDALAIAREVLADEGLPPAAAARPISAAHTEIAIVCQRRRTLIRRRQRLLNEAEGVLSKLPLALREQLPRGGVGARLRALRRLGECGSNELVWWLLEMLEDLLDWERRIDELEARLPALLAACGSTLTQEVGIGVVSAAELVAEIGDPTRFPSEGAFARWAGVAPVPTSSGEGDDEPKHHRLDLLGNRTVNRILYVMSVTQARHDATGKAFLARKRIRGQDQQGSPPSPQAPTRQPDHPSHVDRSPPPPPAAEATPRHCCLTKEHRNLLTRVPKSAQTMVATLVRTTFAQPDAASVWEQHARVVDQLTERFPAAAELLAEAGADVLAFTAFPKEHWKQIWSNNPQERLNKELRRRTDVVGIFPNRDAVIRLVGSVLAEQHDEWAVVRRYMSSESLAKARLHIIDGDGEEVTEHALAEVS